MRRFFEVADPGETAEEVHRLLSALMTQIDAGLFDVYSYSLLIEEIRLWITELGKVGAGPAGLLPTVHEDGTPIVQDSYSAHGRTKVVAYVSFDDPDSQDRDIHAYAARHGLTVFDMIQDRPEDLAITVMQRGFRSGLLYARQQARKQRSALVVRRLADTATNLYTVLQLLSESQTQPFSGLLTVEERLDTATAGGSSFAKLAGRIHEEARAKSRQQSSDEIRRRVSYEKSLGDNAEIRKRLAAGGRLESFEEWARRTGG